MSSSANCCCQRHIQAFLSLLPFANLNLFITLEERKILFVLGEIISCTIIADFKRTVLFFFFLQPLAEEMG